MFLTEYKELHRIFQFTILIIFADNSRFTFAIVAPYFKTIVLRFIELKKCTIKVL